MPDPRRGPNRGARTSVARRLVRRAREVAAVIRRGQRRRLARRLLAVGLFDRAWYERQSGREWRDDVAAAVHYLARGRRAGLSPHPLVEPEWISPARWRQSRRDPVELYLDGDAVNGGPHPMFDDATWLARSRVGEDALAHRGGPLGHFLRTAGPDGVLPCPWGEAPVTLSALRSRAEEVSDLVRAQQVLGDHRTRGTWDAAVGEAYVARWSAVPVPVNPDGLPLVSVVLPVRNRPKEVRAAIASVQAQTFEGWELLLVDDGSDDRTPDVLAEAAAGDDRVRVVTLSWSGVAVARNAGVNAARGRYLAFLDSDNQWVPHFLQVTLAVMEAQSLRAAHAVVEMRSQAGTRYLAHQGGRAELEVNNHVDINTFVAELALVRSVGGFDPTLRRMTDWDLVLRIAALVEPVLLPFVGVYYDDDDRADRLTLREPTSWGNVVKARNLIDWAGLKERLPGRDPGLVSVVVTVADDLVSAWSLVDLALADPPAGATERVEVVVVSRGSRPSLARMLGTRGLASPAVTFLPIPVDGGPALAWSMGLGHTRGARIVLVDAACGARPSGSPASTPWWEPLARALDDEQVAATGPLVVGPGGTLVHAGLGRHRAGAAPYPMFAGAAPEDAGDDPLTVDGLGDEALAVRAADLVLQRGADPWFVTGLWGADLTARVAGDGRRLLTLPAVRVFRATPAPALDPADVAGLIARCADELAAARRWDETAAWQRSGLELTPSDDQPPQLRRAPGRVAAGPAAGRPALRWTIGTAAPFSAQGDRWGDVHFAADLARALRRLGQHVVVERRHTTGRTTAALDDVFVNLRGLDDQPVRPGQVNLLWVISHPDLVTPGEVQAYDAAFAASTAWAGSMSERAGVPVMPLLQATDPSRFHPDLAEPGTGPAVLFVGSSRGVERPIVRDAVAAGLDVAVYGTLWDGLLNPRFVRGSYLPNESVGAAYRAAGVLLNDHWPDMAVNGFYSNRLFDGVAAGARVVSDPVDGIDQLFEGAVLQYRTVDDLARWAGPDRDRVFPDDSRLREISTRVGLEHSFDARAAKLLDSALQVWESDRGRACRSGVEGFRRVNRVDLGP